ncbi:MAG: DUF459 domain-containing protein [Myxococcales bacterium]|nr:DUF459 domain-containing protein [Myxococcales bacterium]
MQCTSSLVSRVFLWLSAVSLLAACGATAGCERVTPPAVDPAAVDNAVQAADSAVENALVGADVDAQSAVVPGLNELALADRARLLAQSSSQKGIEIANAIENPPRLPRPRRVMIVGSSSMEHGIGQSVDELINEFGPVHVRNEGLRSTGLSRPDYYDWLAQARLFADEYRPDLVVAQFGGNDCQGTVDPDGNLVARWSTPEWDVEYARRVTEFITDMRSRGAFVVILGMPTMREERFRARIDVLNRVVQQACEAARVPFIDLRALTSDADGEYIDAVEINGERRGIRSGDGVHLSWAGARYVARATVDVIVQHMALETERPPSPDDALPVVLERSNARPNFEVNSPGDDEGSGDGTMLEDGTYAAEGSNALNRAVADGSGFDGVDASPDSDATAPANGSGTTNGAAPEAPRSTSADDASLTGTPAGDVPADEEQAPHNSADGEDLSPEIPLQDDESDLEREEPSGPSGADDSGQAPTQEADTP